MFDTLFLCSVSTFEIRKLLARFEAADDRTDGSVAWFFAGHFDNKVLQLVVSQVVGEFVLLKNVGEADPHGFSHRHTAAVRVAKARVKFGRRAVALDRPEEHTSELQSLMRISYAVFCLKKKRNKTNKIKQ